MAATKPRSAKTATAKTAKSGSGGGRGAPARRGPARKPKSKAVGSVLGRHAHDIWGLAAVVAGLLVAGSVWASAMGPVGEAIDKTLAWSLGLIRWLVPVVFVGIGVMLVRDGGRSGRAGAASTPAPVEEAEAPEEAGGDEDGTERWVRALMGSGLLLVAFMGIAHVVRGRPGLSAGVEDLGAAGGAIGMAVGGPLHAYIAAFGAVLVLSFFGAVGLMVLTASSARTGARAVFAMVRPVGRMFRLGVRNLFRDVGAARRQAPPAGAAPSPPFDPAAAAAGARPGPPAAARPQPQPPAAQTEPARPAPPAPAAAKPPAKKPARPPARPEPAAVPAGSGWKLPSPDLLSSTESREVDRAEVGERGLLLRDTLAKFGVPTTLLEPVVGPTVTRFVLELGEGIKVSKLESLRKDIALAMASPDVRILAPIPGQRAVGVEVPNVDREVVKLGDILRSAEARAARHPLEVAVGRDINGRAVLMNLAQMPHILIAGATGAGKSSCLNSVITSILMRSTPDQVRMILVDPKRVEMGQYDRAPHLLTAPVTDPRQAANALAWAVREMDRRYDLLSQVGFRDMAGYNTAVARGQVKAKPGETGADGEPLKYRSLPFVLVVVDELSDLMMVAARDVEESIARIAQMARAVGIHLVIATQRPSVDVITGVIKANVPARLAFAVSSLTDSRVILDQSGAERLVGRGDMLLLGPTSSAPHRIQGSWVDEAEVKKVVRHWIDQAPDFREDRAVSSASAPGSGSGDSGRAGSGAGGDSAPGPAGGPAPEARRPPADAGGGPDASDITAAPPSSDSDGDGDDLLDEAMELVVETRLGSTSMLQRRLRVGFARAGRIMDLLEQRGVVGPSLGSKAREVLITPEELADRRGR